MRFLIALLLLAVFPVSGIRADSLGRLFFTPEQRAQLEYNYKRNATADSEQTSVLTVNGIVQQRGGVRTVWINGAAKNAGRGGEPATEAVAVPGKSRPVKIKVGQKLLPDTLVPQSLPASAE